MKVLLTATVQSHICQFHKPLVEVLHAHGCEVHVAARNNLAEKNGLKLDFVERVFDIPFSRSPKSMDNLKAKKMLKTGNEPISKIASACGFRNLSYFTKIFKNETAHTPESYRKLNKVTLKKESKK